MQNNYSIMKSLIIIFFLFSISIVSYGQNDNRDDSIVGFACGEAGGPTQLVVKMTELVKEKKYEEISSLLTSKNTGELYLAILVLERLNSRNLYSLSEEQKNRISKYKSSALPLYNCVGCLSETNGMSEIMSKPNSLGEEDWLNNLIPHKTEID